MHRRRLQSGRQSKVLMLTEYPKRRHTHLEMAVHQAAQSHITHSASPCTLMLVQPLHCESHSGGETSPSSFSTHLKGSCKQCST